MKYTSDKIQTGLQKAFVKAHHWCAYQERCQQEMRDKLYEWGVNTSVVEQVIAELISGGFLNEARFANAFASGKFRIKQWGRIKIKQELRYRKIPEPLIRSALAAIDDQDYMQTLLRIITKKEKTESEKQSAKRDYKIMRYCIARGFEHDLVREIYQELKNQNKG
jgi:regulatory protein